MKTPSDALILNSILIDTPLGDMIAISDENKLYLLEFADRRGLELKVVRLRKRIKAIIIPGKNTVIDRLEGELALYFSGNLQKFTIPFAMLGSEFQKSAWQALIDIPYGQTRSYMKQAAHINNPSAYRAVANANGANQIAILIPCHRIINADGKLGGYGGGVDRKQWLIDHEKNID
jgi:AraC family transcriptional regulator of adaptative response/methylated-DNA-[protein]-cysteine methyltransferase